MDNEYSRKNDLNKIQKYIDAGMDINAKDDNGCTALINAICYSNEDTVKRMINAGADVNAKNRYGRTALMYAVWYSHIPNEAIVKLLIDADADVNAKNNDEQTALMLAVLESKYISTVKLLLDAGANPNLESRDGWTALKCAVFSTYSSKDTIPLLLKAGANTKGILYIKPRGKYERQIKYEDRLWERSLMNELVVLPSKIAFALGRLDPKSIVSKLPKEICKVILDFTDNYYCSRCEEDICY